MQLVTRRCRRSDTQRLELNALVQRVVVTDHSREAAKEMSEPLEPVKSRRNPPEPLCAGSAQWTEIIEDLQVRRKRWGISYYVVVNEPYMDAFAPVVAPARWQIAACRISSAVPDRDLSKIALPCGAQGSPRRC